MTASGAPAHRLADRLGERDWQILKSVAAFRFLTTRQLARQHFDLKADTRLIPRSANHALARLRALGLIVNLARRIGGVRAGSAGYIWTLTEPGRRLLTRHQGSAAVARVRVVEPSTAFLEHTLAVAEVVLTIKEAAQSHQIAVSGIQLEPACWRPYLASGGATARLKPDLAVITEGDGFEDHWFIEVDRATEPPSRVIRKCFQYQQYQHTGIEQRRSGLFPAVIWIVPDQARRHQLRKRLAGEASLSQRLFAVITMRELGGLITVGATDYINNTSG